MRKKSTAAHCDENMENTFKSVVNVSLLNILTFCTAVLILYVNVNPYFHVNGNLNVKVAVNNKVLLQCKIQ